MSSAHLLKPGEYDGERKPVDVRSERIRERRCDDDGAVRVVALPEIENARDPRPRNVPVILLSEDPELAAAKRQDDGRVGKARRKARVVAARVQGFCY